MKALRILSFVLFSALILSSCSSPLTVSTDYDRAVDFSKYKTFGIYQPKDEKAQTISELNKNRIQSAVKAALTQHGLTESANPDLLVNIQAYVTDQKSVSSTTTVNGMGMGGFYRPYMWGGPISFTGNTQYDVNTVKEGSLLIDLIDAKSNSLVWQSAGNKEVDKDATGEKADETITKYVNQMLSTYPPAPIVNTKVQAK